MLDYFVYASISSGKNLDDVKTKLDDSRIYKKLIEIEKTEKKKKEEEKKEIEIKDIEKIEKEEKIKEIENSIAFLSFESEKNASKDSFNYDENNPSGTLFIDYLMNRDKQRRKLDKIIEYVKLHHKYEGFVIVVQSISTFGTIAQIQNYYRQFRENNIYVLCVDYSRFSGLSEYSTSNFAFEKRNDDEYERAYMLIDNLETGEIGLKNRGASPKFTEAFLESYWMYETYQIPENIAIAASGITRSPFHRKCSVYESSVEYRSEIINYAKRFPLEQLPKRFSKLPEKFKELEKIINNNWDDSLSYSDSKNKEEIEKIFDDACIELRIPTIHPIQYKRIKLRQDVGRKGIAASYNYDEDIIRKFEEYSLNPKNELDKFWEKYKSKEL